MLEGALENLKSLGHSEDYFAGKIFTADTNYHSDKFKPKLTAKARNHSHTDDFSDSLSR
jgi:hypothetical protein